MNMTSHVLHIAWLLAPVVLCAATNATGPNRAFKHMEVQIAMRDGVKLYTEIYIPKKSRGSLPFLMTRSPYGAAATSSWSRVKCFEGVFERASRTPKPWFPVIDRNPQTYVDNIYTATESDYKPATQRVYRSARFASHVSLPVPTR